MRKPKGREWGNPQMLPEILWASFLQSAITLGGGSLAGALFLGVIGGFEMLWVQFFAMIMGAIMLAAIAYVTLTTGNSPFKGIRDHVNPVLAWGWLVLR